MGHARSSVHAQPGAIALPAGDSDTLRQAVIAYEADDMPAARALFEAVHARAPTARTFRSLALVAFRQARFADAVNLLDESLASSVKPLTESLRADALALRDEASAEAAAERLEKRAPLVATEEAAPASVPAPPVVTRSTSHGADNPRRRRLKRTGHALLGAGAGALLISLATTAIAIVRIHNAEDRCDARPAGGCTEAEASRYQRDAQLDRLARWTTTSLVLGASSVAAGGVSLLLQLRPGSTERPQLGSLGLSWTRRF